MKIKVPYSVLKDHSCQCWQHVADVVDSRMNAKRMEVWTPEVYELVRSACGDAYASAMNGGTGAPSIAEKGTTRVEVLMRTVGDWEVAIYGQIA